MEASQLQLGSEYEYYVKTIIQDKYKNVWLWKDIPRQILLELNFIPSIDSLCDDIGCDILANNFDGTYDYIQCKNYSTLGIHNTISICDLAGFYNFVAENNILNPIVYYSGILSSQIKTRTRRIKYINIPYFKISDNIIIPRDYQLDAYNLLKDENRSILAMPCGTGKTLISYLISLNYRNIILISPLIATTEQLLAHYRNYYSNSSDIINYNSIHCQGVRSISDISLGDKNIIGATFDSCDIINKLLDKLTGSIFIIIDEFHNLSYNMINNIDNELYKILTCKHKILFISATPKYYDISLNYIFGTVKYSLEWKDAIQNKYICDYNFYFPENDKIIKYIDEIKFDKNIIEKTKLIYKAFYLLESIKSLDMKKCIVYLKSVNEAEQFHKILTTLNIYHELPLAIYQVDYNTTRTIRNNSLTKFRNNRIKICIMLNIHVLDEGIDIP